MYRKRPVPAFIATCILGAMWGAPLLAADLTISSSPYRSPPKAPAHVYSRTGAELRGNKEEPAAKAVPAKRADKNRPHRIVTYTLFNDPVFKLNGALADRRRFATVDRLNRHGAGFTGTMPASPASLTPNSAVSATAAEAASTNGDGIALDCRDKLFRTIPGRRGLTACYRHQVDRSWKTQTYVLRGSSDGQPHWGGGVILSYAE